MRSNSPSVLFAIQKFCKNHDIIETTASELGLKIGKTRQATGRSLRDLGWSLFRPTAHSPYLRRKKDAHKEFKSTSRRIGAILLRKFEAHYETVLKTEEEIRMLNQ